METNTNPAAAAGKGKGKGNSKAKGPAKPKAYVVIGAEGVAAVDKLCAALEASIGFRPTPAQILLRLIAQAAEAAQKPAGEATEAQAS